MESIHPHFKLILGSSSIARRKILTDMGYQFTLMSADIDEKSIRKDKPEELVLALAEAKADAIVSKLHTECEDEEQQPTILIASDTVVVYEDTVREKPSSVEEAREYIRGYSKGHTATVSSVAVTNLKTGLRKSGVDKVEIYFNEIPEETIEKLIEEGTVLKVAGALLIEHPLILPCVKEVAGTTDSVMGLPKELTEKLIKEVLAMTSI
ncbi:PREDICTED: maf-like protein DDB_G0281937 isoform X3 [Camelina sativa]|uniref:Maf-like protein DDB_G0281937 isoform X3 n=1 Tax=Camelina sativa TaxID=90675 RepID=A0ABM0Y1Y4_CAMSA|nr:PREDICTED: maf-like protein DDB_G0281937 isoform X3 [Camelina sativa]XP_010494233.1 PREDICTED: maf-like protein DDB_G0281937 isoform X3 [Camelina sativa]